MGPEPAVRSDARLPKLDGLRGVAILMVLVCHYGFAPSIGQAATTAFESFGFRFFASGVDLFFVLSGFLIGGILLDHRNSPKYFTSFYGRRVFRIFPVYYGFLLLTALVGVIQRARSSPTPVFDAGTPYWMYFAFLQNFSMGWFGDNTWITVSMAWSLALEEQFYLTLPAAVKLVGRRSLVAISCLFVVAAPILRYFLPIAPHTFGVLVLAAMRADGLVAGFLCAVLVRSQLKVSSDLLRLIAVLSAVFAVATHLPNSPVDFLRGTSLAVLYSSVLLLATRGSFAILESALLRFFGTISYSLYLFHQSALVLFRILAHHVGLVAAQGAGIVAPVAALLASIVACWMLWIGLEKPLISWARQRFRY